MITSQTRFSLNGLYQEHKAPLYLRVFVHLQCSLELLLSFLIHISILTASSHSLVYSVRSATSHLSDCRRDNRACDNCCPVSETSLLLQHSDKALHLNSMRKIYVGLKDTTQSLTALILWLSVLSYRLVSFRVWA